MKSPKTKKVVKAWALMWPGGISRYVTEGTHYFIHPTRTDAKLAKKATETGWIIAPVEISFSLPTKKSAGKVGKRKAV